MKEIVVDANFGTTNPIVFFYLLVFIGIQLEESFNFLFFSLS